MEKSKLANQKKISNRTTAEHVGTTRNKKWIKIRAYSSGVFSATRENASPQK
jgi:hypothetical protein